MGNRIVNNRIEGTRITVWDILHYLEGGDWSPQEIADVLGLSLEQVQAAVDYIEQNRDAVLAVHQQIEARHTRGNPPELQARLDAMHEKFLQAIRERQARNGAGVSSEGHRCGS
jgi:uncharacterized protein (DUF433 family)